jgi:Na+-translocating ferredoxin:NAD+ oxidoreductase RnfD subunit
MAAISGDSWWSGSHRLAGLRRFAVAITFLNVLGHFVLGFEQSWAVPLVSLAVAYSLELAFEWLDARANNRKPFYSGGLLNFTDFLLSAHITGLAVAMLLYASDNLWPVAFASGVAMASKRIFRVVAGKGTRHFFNPSNFGITVTLLAFPWVGIAPPYMFTENSSGIFDWMLPAVIVISGSFINYRFTHRMPLVVAWLSGFIAQGVLRGLVFGTPIGAPLVMMTSLPFVLYTFYMVTDPATTPGTTRAQIAFGAGVAAVYGLLTSIHIVFGLFFSLTVVCLVRGLSIYAAYGWSRLRERQTSESETHAPVAVGSAER